jgi:hypothetical protein
LILVAIEREKGGRVHLLKRSNEPDPMLHHASAAQQIRDSRIQAAQEPFDLRGVRRIGTEVLVDQWQRGQVHSEKMSDLFSEPIK